MRIASIIAAAAVAAVSVGIVAGAYTNYCDGVTVSSVDMEYTVKLKDIGTQFDICLSEIHNNVISEVKKPATEEPTTAEPAATQEEAPTAEPEPAVDHGQMLSELYTQRIELFDEYTAELTTAEYDTALMLIDYDLLLKKLEILYDEYKDLKKQAQDSESLFKIGGCDMSAVEADEKAVESKYYDIQALLSEISALKADIEAVTGTKLTSELDFEQAYLIADVIKIDPATLTFITGGATLCVPQGVELKAAEAPDITGQYNTALKCYYALGAAMREYVAVQEKIKKCEAEIKLGEATAEQYDTLAGEKTAAYLSASTAKAELAKALIELDRASGGALTYSRGISYERAMAYKSAVSEAQSGSGCWLIGRTADGVMFMPMLLPKGVAPEEDDVVTYKLEYNGEKIYSGGGYCIIPQQEYKDKCDHAKITYYINGIKTAVYRVDVFSPYGEFIG